MRVSWSAGENPGKGIYGCVECVRETQLNTDDEQLHPCERCCSAGASYDSLYYKLSDKTNAIH